MHNKKFFNKLVRDNIPEIISKKGGESEIRILEDAEYADLLNKKLMEECDEVIEADDTESKKEELADVLEVLHAIAKSNKIDFEEVEAERVHKKEKRGGFEKKIFLKTVTNG